MTFRIAALMFVLAVAGCAHLPGSRSPCTEALNLSRSGDHLDAVKLAGSIKAKGGSCPHEAEDALSFSRMVVSWADDLVKKALKQKEAGDLVGAKVSLNKALKVYPRYYWAGKILSGLEHSIASRAEDLAQEAGYLEGAGDFDGAVDRLNRALSFLPGDPAFMSRLAEVEERRRQSMDGQAVADRMKDALDLMSRGEYDLAEARLTDISPRNPLAGQAADLLTQVRSARFERTREYLLKAAEAQRSGDLAAAFGYLRTTADACTGDADLKARTVDFARQLGLHCYSQGLLSQAREIWSFALKIDPENPKLRSYLDEARYRLENLKSIREQGDGQVR